MQNSECGDSKTTAAPTWTYRAFRFVHWSLLIIYNHEPVWFCLIGHHGAQFLPTSSAIHGQHSNCQISNQNITVLSPYLPFISFPFTFAMKALRSMDPATQSPSVDCSSAHSMDASSRIFRADWTKSEACHLAITSVHRSSWGFQIALRKGAIVITEVLADIDWAPMIVPCWVFAISSQCFVIAVQCNIQWGFVKGHYDQKVGGWTGWGWWWCSVIIDQFKLIVIEMGLLYDKPWEHLLNSWPLVPVDEIHLSRCICSVWSHHMTRRPCSVSCEVLQRKINAISSANNARNASSLQQTAQLALVLARRYSCSFCSFFYATLLQLLASHWIITHLGWTQANSHRYWRLPPDLS